MTQLKAPQHGLSLQFLTADAAWIDWSDLYQDGDEYDVALPKPTYGDVRERAPDLLNDWEEERCHAEGRPLSEFERFNDEAQLSDEHAESFWNTDAFHEWADSFQPMMNYAWPVSLAYGGPSLEEAVELVNRYAGACTLVSFSEGHNPFGPEFASDTPEYGIALTGGGMDLSDHIAVAYLCCGCVPPERILSGLDGFTGCARSGRLIAAADLLREAYGRAADYFLNRAARLTATVERLELNGEAVG
jgi:hypothetical protein